MASPLKTGFIQSWVFQTRHVCVFIPPNQYSYEYWFSCSPSSRACYSLKRNTHVSIRFQSTYNWTYKLYQIAGVLLLETQYSCMWVFVLVACYVQLDVQFLLLHGSQHSYECCDPWSARRQARRFQTCSLNRNAHMSIRFHGARTVHLLDADGHE